MFEAQLRK